MRKEKNTTDTSVMNSAEVLIVEKILLHLNTA